MDVKVEVSALQANACAGVVKTTVETLSGNIFSPVVSDLSFTPTITINGGSISAIPADKFLIGVWAA
jgi:Flp pilus assembly protein TadG